MLRLRRSTAPLSRRADRPRHPAGAPARHRSARRAAPGGVERAPVGNGPFRFVAHEPNRRWVFAADPAFPAALGGPPRLERLIIVVVGRADDQARGAHVGRARLRRHSAGPRRASSRRDPALAVLSLSAAPHLRRSSFNTRRPPFDDARVRAARVERGDRPAGDRRRLPLRVRHAGDAARCRRTSRAMFRCLAPDLGAPRSRAAAPVRAAHGGERRGGAGADGAGAARGRPASTVDDPAARARRVPRRGCTARRTTSTPPCSASRATRAWRYLGPLAGGGGSRGAGGSGRRRSGCSRTRCRWPFSITREDCRG